MTAVSFTPTDAARIANAVKQVERYAGNTYTGEPVPWNDAGTEILFGTAAADYSSGATISLTPCDANSVATGESAVTVTIPTAWGTVNLLSATVAGSTVAVTCKVASGTLLDYAYAANGTPYLVGSPPAQVQHDTRIDTTGKKFQIKVRYAIGTAYSTASDWMDVVAVKCIQDVDLGAP